MNELLERLKALFGNTKNAPSAPISPLQNIADPRFGQAAGPGPAVVSPVNEARDMIMRHEGFRANAYRDAAGKPTIGYGYGFPIFRGGPMLYADQVGLFNVVQAMHRFAANPHDDAEFWKPAPLLAKLAAEGKTFN